MSHQKYAACIEACHACAIACDHCATSCLEEADPGKMIDCIRTNLDCASVCRLAIGSMVRGGDCVEDVCRFCADICDKCADICAQYSHAHCKECAEACRKCSEECRKMAA